MILRQSESIINSKLPTGKAIILLGPRQTGKTTVMLKILEKFNDALILNCDDPMVRNQLEDANTEQLKSLLGKYSIVFIDEAQKVRNIGITLKLITDQIRDVKLLVSGSSALELANEINEPLTGRKWEYFLFPVSWKEFQDDAGYLKSRQQFGQRIIYGMYPEVITSIGNEEQVLRQLTGSYLYKDILSWKGIRRPELLDKLLKALAFQIGNQVSYHELSNMLQADKETISSYIDLLEKAFIVFRLYPLSRNLRNEISSSRKIYFYDTGIRNAIISDFRPITLRNDAGPLWESFLMAERMKFRHYNHTYSNTYFWRNHLQQEIDLVEEMNGKVYAYEFKWGTGKKKKIPSAFAEAYNCPELKIIDPGNFLPFLGID